MKRRTFISLMSVMAAAGVLTLSGCSNSSGSTAASGTAASVAPAAGDQLSNIQSSGKLIVALEGAWQPWSYHDESDTLVGYDVEVSRAIAEKLGVEPEYVESDWDSLFAGLDAGRYDIVCNGVEVTDERAKTYDFTEPYGYIHTALAVRKDNDEITSFEDLKGKTTANSLASTYMELAESYGATVQGIDTLEETIQLLTAGRIDATLNADVSFYDYLNVHPDADFKLVAQTEDASHVAIPVRKGDDSASLLEAINNGTISDAIIDVWEHEPEINRELLEKVLIGTPHIAGYSADGKANATRMSLDSICRFFHLGATYEITPPAPSSPIIEAKDREEALLKMYNPIEDSNRLKSHPELFETLRGDYPLRREAKAYMQVISNR